MSTNAWRTLSNTWFMKSPQAALKASAFTPVRHATNFQQKFKRSFRVDIMSVLWRVHTTSASFFFCQVLINPNLTESQGSYKECSCLCVVNYPHFESLFVRWIGSSFWISKKLEFFCQLGEVQWNWRNERWLRLMLLCALDQLPSWQLSGEVFKRTAKRLQCWICSFSLRLYRWGRKWTL